MTNRINTLNDLVSWEGSVVDSYEKGSNLS